MKTKQKKRTSSLLKFLELVEVKPEIEPEVKPVLNLMNQWYDWNGLSCPKCLRTETISIPEYPTKVCKYCWENKCELCKSVSSMQEGYCNICEKYNLIRKEVLTL